LARQSIAKQLGSGKAEELPAETAERLKDPRLQEQRGTFVTLHKQGSLRGCIGSLTADEPIIESIKQNAVNAAFRDPRFPPLTPEELPSIHIEISLLSEPQPLIHQEAREIVDNLQRSQPGVILKQGARQATFLPQVWSQLPKAEDFLDHLALKAGLPQTAWREGKVELLTYDVQSFEES
jgi:hypothetical protein